MNNNNQNQKPTKKYSGALFLDNDEFDCFVDALGNKIPKNSVKGQKQGFDGNKTTQNDQFGGNHLTNQMNAGFNQNYYNMYNNNPLFPMGQVPMNMPLMNMMGFGNMFYDMENNQNNFENGYNHLMTLTPEQIIDQFNDIMSDQKGCKQLQARIENDGNNSKVFNAIFDFILQRIKHYSEDQFANYLCQKIIELCTREQLRFIVEEIIPDVTEISKSNHGTRVIQKIIENLEDENLVERLLKKFEGNVVDLVLDVNGNHVLQKCLSYFSAERLAFMYNEIMTKTVEVATHKYGCCVLQRCIDYCSDEQIHDVLGGILKITPQLLNDKYGNYVIQYILELQGFEDYKKLIGESINLNIIYYCYQKFSSNVVEKCLKVDVKNVFEKLIEVWVDAQEMKKMISDQFGNYVVQTAMLRNKLSPKIRGVLKEIKNSYEEIKSNPIGAKVIMKLGRTFDFWVEGGEVPLKENQEFVKRRYKKGGRKNFTGGFKKGYGYKKGKDRRGQGYVNMNMSVNFNVNLNYPNQGNGSNNGNGLNTGNNWE